HGSAARQSGHSARCCSEALGKCIAWDRVPKAYFPPGESPDRGARGSSAKIVAAFEAMDRTALHGSHIHRDIIWFTYIAAAIAVLAAVGGGGPPPRPGRGGGVGVAGVGGGVWGVVWGAGDPPAGPLDRRGV